MPSASTKAKDIRTQGVASVTQDMSSARLKILGDLMENRKRAEQHEQEFLRTIHSENAAFSRIVSLFEESIEEVKENTELCSNDLVSFMESQKAELSSAKSQLEQRMESEVNSIKQTMEKLESSSATGVSAFSKQLDALQSKLMALVSSSEFKSKEDTAKMDELKKALSTLSASVTTLASESDSLRFETSRQLETLSSEVHQQLATIKSEHESSLARIQSVFEKRMSASEANLRALIDSRIGGMEEQLGNKLKEEREGLEALISDSAQSASQSLKTEIRDELKISSSEINGRLLELEQRVALLPDTTVVTHEVEKIVSSRLLNDNQMNASEERVKYLEDQLRMLKSEIHSSLTAQTSMMNAIAHAGFRYEWNITNAIARFTSLGLLGGNPGKFVSSENFTLGPYKNLSLRFFPISTVNGDSPTVWLVARPASPDSIVPVYVDIGIGQSKRGPLKRKQVQELFGHWVWEASFSSDIMTAEMQADDLPISVEISMRQWMDLDRLSNIAPTVQTDVPDIEGETPESPSAMSNYTFVPIPQTNPFENTGSVTPRRSSWAQFGSPPPDENTALNTSRLASNPFK